MLTYCNLVVTATASVGNQDQLHHYVGSDGNKTDDVSHLQVDIELLLVDGNGL